MDNQKLQKDKLHLINWIAQIQDHAIIEKIKALMSTSNENLQFTKEQELLYTIKQGKEISSSNSINEFDSDAKIDYEL
jgi:excinuclease UvrABC nuclease subunit